jgi:hypothetical protein
MTIRSWLVSGVIILTSLSLKSQSITSPYTSYGIGEIMPVSYAHNEAMGGLGVGLPTVYFVNNRNAAWLPYNIYTTFQVGVKTDLRNYLVEGSESSDVTGSLDYISFAFPIINNKWGTHVSLSPFSSVNYRVVSNEIVGEVGDFAQTEFSGSGGLSQLRWSNGFNLFKGLNVGITGTYVFGQLDRTIENLVFAADSTQLSEFRTGFFEEKTYSDITFEIAVGHRITLSEEKAINYGLTYRLEGQLNGTEDVTLQRRTVSGNLIQAVDVRQGESIGTNLPSEINFGFSYQNSNKLDLGVDVGYGLWAGSSGLEVESRDAMSVILGGSYTPDYKSVNRYLERVMYKFGFAYRQLPYVVNSTEINDFGINFGASFPVSGLSSLDTSFKFGVRGTTDNSLIRESYFQFILGLTINDRWFVKRRYD